jgi:Flp pilus assembly protein TadD
MALRWSGGEDAEARFGMGRCLEMLGDIAGAEASLTRASSLPAAKSALAWLWARRVLDLRKDRDWKARILKDVEPPHPARLLAEGAWEPLMQYSAMADQDNDTLMLAQGAAAIELNRWDDAVARLDRFLRVRPRDGMAYFYRGVALMGKGDRTGASAAWAEAIKCNPTDRTLQAEIAKRSVIRNQ